MEKALADVENKKIQKILEKAMKYHWETIHIKGDDFVLEFVLTLTSI